MPHWLDQPEKGVLSARLTGIWRSSLATESLRRARSFKMSSEQKRLDRLTLGEIAGAILRLDSLFKHLLIVLSLKLQQTACRAGLLLDRAGLATYNRISRHPQIWRRFFPEISIKSAWCENLESCPDDATELTRCTPCEHEEDRRMSFEVFEKLEAKVQQAIDTITLLQMEIEELKEQNNNLSQEVQQASGNHESLVRENAQLKEEQHVWQDRLRALLGKMEEV
jgi:cell division protein ZapB